MKKFNLLALAVAGLACTGAVNAKVLQQDTSINFGYWVEMGSDSDASNQYDETNIILAHRTLADWGSISVKGKIENLGQTADDVNGNEGTITYKTFVTGYYNLADTGFQLWYDEFSAANRAISENHHYVGLAYGTKAGGLNIKLGVGADYTFGHTPKGSYEGFNATAARLNFSYPMMKGLLTFAMVEYRWDIDEEIAAAHSWQDSGYHAVLGAKYRISSDWDVAAAYHKFDSWGGYNEGGDSITMTFGYHF